MREPRLKSAVTASALVRQSSLEGRYAVVARRGDADSGAILLYLRSKGACVVLSQTRLAAGQSGWLRGTGAEPVSESVADAYIDRQVRMDPDLWVIEVEGPDLDCAAAQSITQ